MSENKASGWVGTVAYDVAEQLRTPEEQMAYLNAWLMEAPEDQVGIARALHGIARARRRLANLDLQLGEADRG